MSAERASLAPPPDLGVPVLNIPARRVWALAQAGAIALAVIAWDGSATKASPTRQVFWAGVAAVAVAVSGTVNALWLARARRVVGFRQRQVMADIRAVGERHAPAPARGLEAGDATLVAVEGMALYHRVGCVLMRGRQGARPGHAPDHEAAGRQPCGWCLPHPVDGGAAQ